MTTLGVWTDEKGPSMGFAPVIIYSAIALASGTIAASSVAGAEEVYLLSSGATALTLPPPAQVYALLQGILPNMTSVNYYLRIINTNAGTLTLTAGTGNTITGTATLATNTTRDFLVTITSPTTITYQSIGTGTTS